jgi:hypothetical protein
MYCKTMMMAAFFAMSLALVAPAAAQDNSAEMRAMAAHLRKSAQEMRALLTQAQIEQMLETADELDRKVAEGAFKAPSAGSAPTSRPARIAPAIAKPQPSSQPASERIRAEHNGRLDWLAKEEACSGFIWETADFFRMQTGNRDDERNAMCAAAWREYRTYFVLTRDQGGYPAEAMRAIERYEAAAHAVVDFYERR